jgi:uncharacterized membrane protein YqaE (UPF0057 family)
MMLDNLRPGETIREISGNLRRVGRGECFGYSRVFYVVAPPVSVKDRGVGTREQVLNVLIACRCYGPSKPNNLLSTDVWLSLLLQCLCWERNWVADLRITQPGYGLCWEPFFSEAVGSIQRCWWLVKGCHVWGSPAGSVRQAYVD